MNKYFKLTILKHDVKVIITKYHSAKLAVQERNRKRHAKKQRKMTQESKYHYQNGKKNGD